MDKQFYGLATLRSLDSQAIEHLHSLGINNLGDLLAYQPLRYARFVRAAKDQLLSKEEIIPYLDKAVREKSLTEIIDAPAESLKDIGPDAARVLAHLGIDTIGDLASYEPFNEAEELVSWTPSEDADPFAPGCVLPRCKKFTRNSKSFVSFFKQEEIRSLSVLTSGKSLVSNLFRFSPHESQVIYLGYSVSYLQEWIYCGVHLGEPQGSVNLFMGQDTQISVLDWRRAIRALRTEDTRITERLASTLFHQRAVDEVARATAEEHQHGGTSAFGANAATAGSLVAAGALIGGVGGGISGALAGLSVDALTGGSTAGLGTLSGAVVGTAVGSVAGAAAGSLIVSGATTLGFVETDAAGDREIFAKSAQNIQQRTIQNSSSLRSFWSNIITQSVQEEQQRLRTDRVTNHNRIHGLNAIYFEVLNEYRLNIRADDVAPILFLPFKPIFFTEETLRRYWWLIRTFLNDRELVLALDQHFLTLSSEPSPATQLADLPEIGEVETERIEVEVNLDGSAMEEILKGLFGVLLPTGGITAVMAAFNIAFDAAKRENVKVSLVTSDGTKSLTRQSSPNVDANFVGRYVTTERIAIGTIEQIKIANTNAEFSVLGMDLNKLAFEGVEAKISIRNKNSLRQVLPDIGSLEEQQRVGPGTFEVAANSSKKLDWSIADRLRAQFEGIATEREDLEGELSAEERLAARTGDLLNFLNANKYAFTRLILQNTEVEQVMNALEEVEVGGVDLSVIAGTTPIGFCGTHVVLPLKNAAIRGGNHDPIGLDTSKLELILAQFDQVDSKKPQEAIDYFTFLRDFLVQFLQAAAAEGNGSEREKQLLERIQELVRILDRALRSVRGNASGRGKDVSTANMLRSLRLFQARITSAIDGILRFLRAPTRTNDLDVGRLRDYYKSVKASLAKLMGKIIRSDEVSLPSPAVFMEPVLSNAKGAELYDMRRNSHYEILPAPGIGTVDPNVIRSQDPQLTPNVPSPSLSIQNAPDYPLPGSIAAALAEAGKLDLSTLISTNAGTLNTTLSNLSAVATELAKASAQLAGDAQKQALATAGDVARQVGDIIGRSLHTPPPAPPAPKPDPPKGLEEKAIVYTELGRINKSQGTEKEKREKKETLGVPVAPEDTFAYQMSILFLDENLLPYPSGDFTLSLSFFELGQSFDINGGAPIPMSGGEFFFRDLYTLKKGRMATIRITADLLGAVIPGIKEFVLPAKPDIVFRCRMLSETHKITETDVKSAVDEAVRNSSLGVALNPILSSFLNAGVEFPFKIFKIKADGGGKTELNLRAEYNRAGSDTTTTTDGSTTVTEFEVILPKNGWIIEVV